MIHRLGRPARWALVPAFLLALDELLRRLEFGLPAAARGLMALPVALSRGQYLALFAAGGRSVDTVVTLSPDALENCVGRAAAKTIREIRQETAVVAPRAGVLRIDTSHPTARLKAAR